MLRQRHHDAARPDDSSLLASNFGDRVAQKFLMVKCDVGNHAHQRFDDVGRVQPAAHTHFQNRDIHPSPRKVLECQRGQHLKKAGMPGQFPFADEPLGGSVDYVVKQGEIIVADSFAVDANALVDPDQMRRGVESRAQT